MFTIPKVSSNLRNELFFTFLAYIPYALCGLCRSFSAFLLPQLRSSTSTFHITTEEETWIGSLTLLTMPVGCLIAGVMMHYLGRKLCLMSIMIPYIAAWTTTVYATDVNMLYLETILNGIGAGMTVCTATYVAEISSRDHRGTMLSLEEPVFNLGIATCNMVMHFFGWQFSSKCFLGLSIVSFFILIFLPESPNWLVMKGYSQKATEVLTKVRQSEMYAKEEINEMEVHYELRKRERTQQHEFNAAEKPNLLLECWKPLTMMLGLFTLQQASGYNILVSYTVIFFDELRVPMDSSLLAIIYSSVSFICSFIAPIATIYVGRRFSLAFSGFGMGVFMLVSAAYEISYSHLPIADKPYILIPIISVYGYNVLCSIGVMMMPFIMAGEVFPVHISVIACGISGCLGNIVAGLILKIYPHFLSYFGLIPTLCTLAIFCFLNVPYALYIMPETRGKSINQIQQEYFVKSTKTKPCPAAVSSVEENC